MDDAAEPLLQVAGAPNPIVGPCYKKRGEGQDDVDLCEAEWLELSAREQATFVRLEAQVSRDATITVFQDRLHKASRATAKGGGGAGADAAFRRLRARFELFRRFVVAKGLRQSAGALEGENARSENAREEEGEEEFNVVIDAMGMIFD